MHAFDRVYGFDGGNLRKSPADKRYVREGSGPTPISWFLGSCFLKAGSPGTDLDFIDLLKKRSAKKDPLMMEVQEEMFDKLYSGACIRVGQQVWIRQTALLLGHRVIRSFIPGSMLGLLMTRRFPEKKPSDGGKEEDWIKAYTEVLPQLAGLPCTATRFSGDTTYRCDCYLKQISKDNWDLEQTPVVMHGTLVDYV